MMIDLMKRDDLCEQWMVDGCLVLTPLHDDLTMMDDISVLIEERCGAFEWLVEIVVLCTLVLIDSF